MADDTFDWNALLQLDGKPEITGQIIARNSCTDEDGRRIVMIVGVLAVPADDPELLKGEHQYTIVGTGHNLTILTEAKDMTDELVGLRADQILCRPLWRV